MSFLTQSHQVFFGRPLCLIPSTSHVIQRLSQSLSSFRSTGPNHLNLLFFYNELEQIALKQATDAARSWLPRSARDCKWQLICIQCRQCLLYGMFVYKWEHFVPSNTAWSRTGSRNARTGGGGNGGAMLADEAQLTTGKLNCARKPSDATAYTSVKISAWWISFAGATGGSDFWTGVAAALSTAP